MSSSTADKINDLVKTCKDGEEGYRDAAEGTTDFELKTVFQTLAKQRQQFARELQDDVRRLGEEPRDSGSLAGAMHRGWIDLKEAIAGRDDTAILKECARGDEAAVEDYEDALKAGLPAESQALVRRQHGEIREALAKIRALQNEKTTD